MPERSPLGGWLLFTGLTVASLVTAAVLQGDSHGPLLRVDPRLRPPLIAAAVGQNRLCGSTSHRGDDVRTALAVDGPGPVQVGQTVTVKLLNLDVLNRFEEGPPIDGVEAFTVVNHGTNDVVGFASVTEGQLVPGGAAKAVELRGCPAFNYGWSYYRTATPGLAPGTFDLMAKWYYPPGSTTRESLDRVTITVTDRGLSERRFNRPCSLREAIAVPWLTLHPAAPARDERLDLEIGVAPALLSGAGCRFDSTVEVTVITFDGDVRWRQSVQIRAQLPQQHLTPLATWKWTEVCSPTGAFMVSVRTGSEIVHYPVRGDRRCQRLPEPERVH